MSLPLRRPLESVTSLDRVLEDLIVRFIINCPPEDFSSVERELFHVEEATWFYTDFVKLMNPKMPNLKIKSFAQHVIKLCPMVWKWDVRAEQALQKFSQYKRSIPVRGAAIFNRSLTKLLLVKGIESESWSFPRGKISKDEGDVDCCIREVLEETGFDISDYIDEEQFIERTIAGKNYKIFLVSGVPEDFDFQPQVRNEIEKIQWHDFKKLSRNNGNKQQIKIYLVNTLMRPLAMWAKSHRQIDNDDKLKAHVETQLKLLLGIKKEETPDPGRELLNMLQSSVAAPQEVPVTASQSPTERAVSSNMSQDSTPAANAAPPMKSPPPQLHQNFPFMLFQPFAPFPFMAGAGMQAGGPVPGLDTSSSNSVQTQPPPTPSMNTTAKPTVAEEDEEEEEEEEKEEEEQQKKEQRDTQQFLLSEPPHPQSTTSKQLLDLLNRKNSEKVEPTEQQAIKPKFKILKRGECLTPPLSASQDNVDADSKALLSLLKKPQQPSISSQVDDVQLVTDIQKPVINPPANLLHEEEVSPQSVNTQSAASESEYEDFESSSEDGDINNDQDEVKAPILEDEGNFGQKYEHPNTNPNVSYGYNQTRIPGPMQGLKEQSSGATDVPHKDSSNLSEQSTGGTFITQSSKSQSKPKIKLLKRGESLKDMIFMNGNRTPETPETPQAVNNASHEGEGNELLKLLKKDVIPSTTDLAKSDVEIRKDAISGNEGAEESSPLSTTINAHVVTGHTHTPGTLTGPDDAKDLLNILHGKNQGSQSYQLQSTPEVQQALSAVDASRGNSSIAGDDILNMLPNGPPVGSPTAAGNFLPGIEAQFRNPYYNQYPTSSGMPIPPQFPIQQSYAQPPYAQPPYAQSPPPNQNSSQQLLGMLKNPHAGIAASPAVNSANTSDTPFASEKGASHELLSLLQRR
ncbi:LAQU0S05e02366g1_1 [Lachancea quebecensis]|uniref:LAQU0S05e02366g1_1 n=1 Tax=Lachancea quebecensis TaxID=1654605 RepID=A0A0P1KQW2_9SACH|nr:LAQU0S05e02366g1_1 [Lachancea quebecensis]